MYHVSSPADWPEGFELDPSEGAQAKANASKYRRVDAATIMKAISDGQTAADSVNLVIGAIEDAQRPDQVMEPVEPATTPDWIGAQRA